MNKCKCIKLPDNIEGMKYKLKLGELYYYKFSSFEETDKKGQLNTQIYYSLFTLDEVFIMGGIGKYFYDNFMDLHTWRKQRIEKLLCNN